MGTIWVKEFTGGLDTRRMPVAASGAVLVKGENGHINRGGEFEKRPAFVPTYALPAGTVGMAATVSSLYVFGSGAAPGGLPVGVTYQRLQHIDGVTALTRVLSYDLYASKLYVVGQFADGTIEHFYDGARVTDWFDGRARAAFAVTGGALTPAVAAHGSFEMTGGTNNIANQVTDIKIDGVSLMAGAVTHTGNNATTAAAIAAAINSHTSAPDYTAVASGQTVTITAAATGATPNGKAIIVTGTGDVTTGNFQNMAGGAAAVASRLAQLYVGGVSIISGAVSWTTTAEQMAADIAAAVNSYTSAPDYSATAVGTTVNIVAVTPGAAANGRVVDYAVADGLTLSPPAAAFALANGADAATTFQPGPFVRTIGSKAYSVSGPNIHFSGIDTPNKWTTDNIGAGFIDMSKQSSGAEELVAVVEYQNYAAIFSGRVILIWYFDPDPTLNRKVQVLKNTGAASGQSVTQFGDNDVFYLDESGLRSLRARDASNAAATSDIGVPVDTLVTAKLKTLSDAERENVIGLIEPTDGRFWLIMKDTIFVFSFFSGSKISAWTTYKPGYDDGAGTITEFDIDAAVILNRRVYVRSANKVYCFSGTDDTATYDATVAEAWLPYLDANAPTRRKNWQGVDAALEGEWEVRYAMQPTDEDAEDLVGIIFETSFNQERIPSLGESTHISPRFRSKGSDYARLSSVVIHYEGEADED